MMTATHHTHAPVCLPFLETEVKYKYNRNSLHEPLNFNLLIILFKGQGYIIPSSSQFNLFALVSKKFFAHNLKSANNFIPAMSSVECIP